MQIAKLLVLRLVVQLWLINDLVTQCTRVAVNHGHYVSNYEFRKQLPTCFTINDYRIIEKIVPKPNLLRLASPFYVTHHHVSRESHTPIEEIAACSPLVDVINDHDSCFVSYVCNSFELFSKFDWIFFKCLPRDRDPDYIITAVLEAMKVRDKSVVVSRSCKIATVASREDLVSIVKTSQVCNVGFILLRICVCRNSFGLYNYRAAGRQ